MAQSKVIESFLTKNAAYRSAKSIKVRGIMIHSEKPSDNDSSALTLIKKWSSPRTSYMCPHALIDGNTGDIYQTLPWDWRGVHCGGSGNESYIGVVICEPKDITYLSGAKFTYEDGNIGAIRECIAKTYNSAVDLVATLCAIHDLNPLDDGVILSHREAHAKGLASNRGDIDHLWAQTKTNYTMNGFRQDVANKYFNYVQSNAVGLVDEKCYYVRKSFDDETTQLGVYTDLKSAKDKVDAYAGYKVYDKGGALIYPMHEVPFKFQIFSGEKPLTIFKEPSNSSAKWAAVVPVGVFTILKIQNGSGSRRGFGLLKSYSARANGWVNLDSVKHVL